MTAENALRYVLHEAEFCHDRDAHEALCLLLPPLARCLDLRPMTGAELIAFRKEFKAMLETDFRFDAEPSAVGCGGPT
jgi:hypothetical protein